MAEINGRKIIIMTKNVLAVLTLFLILVTGCSVPMTKPADVVEALPSPTPQLTRTPTPISEKVTPSVVPAPSPTFTPVASQEGEAPAPTEVVVTTELEKEEKKPALFFFYADWCAACDQMRPVIEELEPEYSDRIRFNMVDVDDRQNRELVMMAGVRAIPLTVFVTAPDGPGQRWIGPRVESVLRAAFDEVLE